MTSPQRRRQATVMVAALLLSVAGMLPVTLTGALAVQIRAALSLSGTWLGVLVAAFFLAGAALSSVVGAATDRAGWRRAWVVVALASAGSLLAAALLVTDRWVAVVVLGVGGVAMSASVSTSNLVLAQEMPGHRLGLLLGVKQSAIPLAGLASGLAVPLVGLTLGWRSAFAMAAVVPLAAVVAARSISPDPRTGPTAPTGRGAEGSVDRGAVTEVLDEAAVGSSSGGPPDRSGRVSPTPRLRVVAVGGGFASVVPGVLTGFTVVTAVDAGMGEAAAGTLLAVASVLGILVRVSTGWSMDRTDRDGYGVVALLLAVGTLGACLLATGRLGLVVPGVLLAFAGGWGWPAVFFYELLRDHPTAPAAATGHVQGPSMLGTAVGPIAFGWITDTVGVDVAWVVVTALGATAAIVLTVATRLVRPSGSLARGPAGRSPTGA